jgi:3-deoxy-D-arabino-heptulosonate 7-phosphate (DAHP) synthase
MALLITDACINLPTTLELLDELASAVRAVREQILTAV